MLRLHGSGLVFVFPNRKKERKNAESLTWSCRVTEKRLITYTSLRTPLSAAESVVRYGKGITAAHHRGNYRSYGKRERASYRTAVFAEDCRIEKEQGSYPALFCYLPLMYSTNCSSRYFFTSFFSFFKASAFSSGVASAFMMFSQYSGSIT